MHDVSSATKVPAVSRAMTAFSVYCWQTWEKQRVTIAELVCHDGDHSGMTTGTGEGEVWSRADPHSTGDHHSVPPHEPTAQARPPGVPKQQRILASVLGCILAGSGDEFDNSTR